jgi:hypothetical protein
LFAQKKTDTINRSSSPKTATFEAESRRFIGRSVRSSGLSSGASSARSGFGKRSLICTGCFRDFCVADQSPSLDKFYRSGFRGRRSARGKPRARHIDARKVRPTRHPRRSIRLPARRARRGRPRFPRPGPRRLRPHPPVLSADRDSARGAPVTRIALAARAARRLPGPARSGGSRPDPDRSTSD